jgi:hypothetical protein
MAGRGAPRHHRSWPSLRWDWPPPDDARGLAPSPGTGAVCRVAGRWSGAARARGLAQRLARGGGCVGLLAHGLPVFPLPVLSLLILGTLVAADLRVPLLAVTALALGLGLLHGFLNGVAMQQAGAGVLGLLGLLAALFVLVALVAAGVVSLHQQWARIAVQVAGSWMAAIGLLMLGWALRGGN